MKKNIHLVFNLFLLSHLVIWTLIPFFSNKNLPLDVIEALAWGSNLDWGFEKHPPLCLIRAPQQIWALEITLLEQTALILDPFAHHRSL